MTAERRLFESIPSDLDVSWIVNYLIGNKFSPLHVQVLRNKTKTGDKQLSSMLNIAPKTFVSYTKDITKTKIDTKEHILLLIALIKHGVEVFGTEDHFNNWLESQNVYLDNKKPLDFLNTISGIRMIDDRLVALEYGDNV